MTVVGTPIYMAPEVLRGEKYTIKCDVWSIGTTIYELVTGYLPFKVSKIETSPIKIVQKISTENLDLSPAEFNHFPI